MKYRRYRQRKVVSYRNSTSNHNHIDTVRVDYMLYLIEILHQTTTVLSLLLKMEKLYLIEILHQTTTPGIDTRSFDCCILSKFYIKPQLVRSLLARFVVVSYRNSTSNHNNARRQWRFQQLYLIEILHQTTTTL